MPFRNMQALANRCNGRVKPFAQSKQAPCHVRSVQCRAHPQQTANVQQVAAAMLAASVVAVPAAHAATEAIQSGVDLSMAVGSGAAVAGLGALLVAADPQKRSARAMNPTARSLLSGMSLCQSSPSRRSALSEISPPST